MTLEIRAIMNSAVEEIFAFKSCCGLRVFDQNLEIQIANHGSEPMRVPSYFDLKDSAGSHRIETLIPHGELSIAPGDTRAFYCAMDERRWQDAEEILFYDTEGNTYPLKIR